MSVVERIIKPTKERRRHGGISRADTMPDTAGNIGQPYQVSTLLWRLERSGDIDAPARAAGEEFHRLFHLAAIDPLRAADVGRVPRGYGGVVVMPGSDSAYHKIGDALTALGGLASPCGSCAYFVLGLDLSLREFAARRQWRGANPHGAKGVLVGTLGVLVKHFGY